MRATLQKPTEASDHFFISKQHSSLYHIFAILMYYLLRGPHAVPFEDLPRVFKTFWECFESTCGQGVMYAYPRLNDLLCFSFSILVDRHRNGQGDEGREVCVNPFHYRIRASYSASFSFQGGIDRTCRDRRRRDVIVSTNRNNK